MIEQGFNYMESTVKEVTISFNKSGKSRDLSKREKSSVPSKCKAKSIKSKKRK